MLESFHHRTDRNAISFTREQASRFAKDVADDYNPIHDVEAKRFCVPGDLLFAVLLNQIGLYQQMAISFEGMVVEGVGLNLRPEGDGQVHMVGENDKNYLHARFGGEVTRNEAFIEHLIRSYVQFSGHNFPHILQPLMAEHNVMINPARPLVMYQSMSIDLETFDATAPDVKLASSSLVVEGKRGTATLNFDFLSGDRKIGSGEKLMVLSGLREYEQSAIDEMVHAYDERKRLQVT